jgi:hypothetical protein
MSWRLQLLFVVWLFLTVLVGAGFVALCVLMGTLDIFTLIFLVLFLPLISFAGWVAVSDLYC